MFLNRKIKQMALIIHLKLELQREEKDVLERFIKGCLWRSCSFCCRDYEDNIIDELLSSFCMCLDEFGIDVPESN